MATTTNTLRLKVGGKYKTRDGRVAEIHRDAQVGTFPFRGQVTDDDNTNRGWTEYGQWGFKPGYALDLVSEIQDEIQDEAHGYRYFTYRNANPTARFHVIWRVAPGSDIVEGICPNVRDEWTHTSVDLQRDLIDAEDIVECDANGNPLEPTPIVSSKTTEDLTPESRTRIAKLAARIVLADGPVFTVDELAGMTIGELVCKLEGRNYQL